jgi:hypothetical protein
MLGESLEVSKADEYKSYPRNSLIFNQLAKLVASYKKQRTMSFSG